MKLISLSRRYLPSLEDCITVEDDNDSLRCLSCDAYNVGDMAYFCLVRIPAIFGEGDHCFYKQVKIGSDVKVIRTKRGRVIWIRPV